LLFIVNLCDSLTNANLYSVMWSFINYHIPLAACVRIRCETALSQVSTRLVQTSHHVALITHDRKKKNGSLLTDWIEPGVPLVGRKLPLRLRHVAGNGLRPSNWLMSAVWKHRRWMIDAVRRRRKCRRRSFYDGDVRCQRRQWACDWRRRHTRSTLVVAATRVVENTRQYVRSSFGRQRLRVLCQSSHRRFYSLLARISAIISNTRSNSVLFILQTSRQFIAQN